MSYSVILHKGKQIHYFDYRGLGESEALKVMETGVNAIQTKQQKQQLLLVNVTGVFPTSRLMDAVKESGKITKPFVKRSAIIGAKGVKKTLLKVYNYFTGDNIRACETEEEAKDYLLGEDKI